MRLRRTGDQEDWHPPTNDDEVVPDFSQHVHELDEDRLAGGHGLGCVVPAAHHFGLSLCSNKKVAASSPRALDPTRSR